MSHSKMGRKIKVLKSIDKTLVDSVARRRLELIATTDVVSLLFSSSSSKELEMRCLTGTSTGICTNFFGTGLIVSSRFLVRHWSEAVETPSPVPLSLSWQWF